MPEVSGDATFIIDPFKPQEITQAMFEIQANPKLRQVLSEKGLKRAEYFSWKNMALNVLELYKKFDKN